MTDIERSLGRFLTVAGSAGIFGTLLWADQGELAIAALLLVGGVGLLVARAQLDGLVDVVAPLSQAGAVGLEQGRAAARYRPAMRPARAVAVVVLVVLFVVGLQLAPVVLLESGVSDQPAEAGIAAAEEPREEIWQDNPFTDGAENVIYVEKYDVVLANHQGSRAIQAYDPKTGERKWRMDVSSSGGDIRSLDYDAKRDNIVIVTGGSVGIESWDWRGSQNWRVNRGDTELNDIGWAPEVDKYHIASLDDRVYQFDPESQSRDWSGSTDANVYDANYDIRTNTVIGVDGRGNAHAFNASDGSKKWSRSINSVNVLSVHTNGTHAFMVGSGGDAYMVEIATSNVVDSVDFTPNDRDVGLGLAYDEGNGVLYVSRGGTDYNARPVAIDTNAFEVAWVGDIINDRKDGTATDTERIFMGDERFNGKVIEAFGTGYEAGEPLNGTVTDGNGNPAANVTVTATNTSTNTLEGSATTDSSGSYSLSVPAGDYDIEAGSSGYKNETKTKTVPSGGLTANFTLRFLGDVNGYVVDQNGNPVEGATVYATGYDTASPPSIDGRSVDDIFNNPYPQDFKDQQDADNGFSPEQSQTWDIDDGAIESGPRVLMHTPGDWETGSVPDGFLISDLVYDGTPPDNIQARSVVAPGTVHFACWEAPTVGVTSVLGSDPVDSSLPGIVTSTDCEEVTIEAVDATGDTLNTRTVEPNEIYTVYGASNLGSKTHEIATAELDAGVYRVYPEDRVEDSFTYAVAPKGDIDNLEPRVDNANDSDLETKSKLNEEIKQLESNGELEVESTITDASGYYALTFENPDAVDSAELHAVKAGGDLSSASGGLELSRQDLIAESESAVKENFRNAEGAAGQNPTEFLNDADNSRADFRNICSNMDPVADDVGVPYSGRAQTDVPSNDTEIRGYRATPPGLDSTLSECMAASLAQSLLENGLGFLDNGLLDDASDLSESELQKRVEKIMPLLQANDDLRKAVEDATGVEIDSSDPSDYSRDELEDISSKTTEELDDAAGTDGNGAFGNQTDEDLDGDTGSGDDGVFGGDDGGGGGYSPPTDSPLDDPVDVDSGEGNITENDTDVPGGSPANDTLNWKFVVDNVDNWDQAQVLIRLHYSDGTTDLLSKQDPHVDVKQRTGRSDWVFIRDYPIPVEPSAVEAEIDVVTPNGVDGDTSAPAKTPSFNGEIPSLRSMKLSTLEPRPGENVTLSVTPERGTAFGGLKQVNVTYPNGTTTTVTANADDQAYLTMADEVGTHRLEVVLLASNEATEFVETTRLRTVTAKAGRPPTIRATSGPTGKYAIVSDGLERGTVNIADNRSHIEVIAVAPETGAPPSQVNAYVNSIDTNSDLTTTVKVRQGTSESNVRRSVGVRVYGPQRSSDAIYFRDGEPLPSGGQNEFGSIEHQNGSTVIDTYTDGTGTVTVSSIEDPDFFTYARHFISLRAPNLPFLSVVSPTAALPSSPPSSGGFPAPIQALFSLSMLAGGVVTALWEVGL